MLNFDPARFLRIQTGTVSIARDIGTLVGRLVAEGADSLFFMGSGGAGILMQPATDLMRRASNLPCHNVLCAEIVLTGHVALGPKSVVIMPSLSGTTKESIAAMDYVKARGATVISITGHAETPLAKGADHSFVNFAEDDTSCEMFYVTSLVAVLAAMRARCEWPGLIWLSCLGSPRARRRRLRACPPIRRVSGRAGNGTRSLA